MKNFIIILTTFILSSAFVQAQFSVKKLDGTPINNNDVISFSVNTYPDANMGFHTFNDGTEPIFMQIEVMEINNTDGTSMELCYGLCYQGVTVGAIFPTSSPLEIPAGENQGSDGDHFFNSATGDDPNMPVSYVFNFVQVDEDGNQVGEPLQMTYEYNPDLAAVEDVAYEQNVLQAYPNPAQDNIQLQGDIEGLQKVNILNFEGRLIESLEVQFSNGNASLNLSGLHPGNYILQVSEGSKKYTATIIKK